MGVLSSLEPKKVFYYFEEITKIPHGSGNVEQISNYLKDFAAARKLTCIQDDLKNIIIIKEASEGYEKEPPMILQGHMDMVAVKKPDAAIDMKCEGLTIAVEHDLIYAEGTSLGGDDGIAVAFALALLDSEEIKHPRLEVVITVDEEVGMDGARGIDLSMLKGRRMLNLDSEDEGVFLTSCAGGARVKCYLPLAYTTKEGIAYEVRIEGLLGGHSGDEIHKERGNSNCLMGRLLYRLAQRMEIGVQNMKGGLADNAIPRETTATVIVDIENSARFAEILDTTSSKIREELAVKDPGFRVNARTLGKGEFTAVYGAEAMKAAAYLFALPCGVQAMSAEMPGLVETSLNLGILELKEDGLHGEFSVRSCIESSKQALIARLEAVSCLAGASLAVSGDYPGWKYRTDSPLREKMIALYEKMYGAKPRVEAIHAGLECGILGSKIDDLDCVSIGPDMENIHTTEETLSISSTRRVWEFLVRLLAEKG